MSNDWLDIPKPRLPKTLEELAKMANAEQELAERHARKAIVHIVRAGHAYLRARDMCDAAAWENFMLGIDASLRTVQCCMRLAHNWELLKEHAPPEALTSQRRALKALTQILADRSPELPDGTPDVESAADSRGTATSQFEAQRAARPDQPTIALAGNQEPAGRQSAQSTAPLIERSLATCAIQDAVATLQFVLDEFQDIAARNTHLAFIYGRVREAQTRLRQIVGRVVGEVAIACQAPNACECSSSSALVESDRVDSD